MGNAVVHFEIGGKDLTKTRDFYSELFGWDISVDEATGYGSVETGSDLGIRGGLMQTPPGAPPYVTFYVAVDDLDKCLERAETLGGKRLVGPMDIEEVGSFAIFTDPDGIAIGIFRETNP